MGYQGEGEGEIGRETVRVAGRKIDLSGQDEQQLEKLVDRKNLREFGCLVGWRVEVGHRRENDKYEAEQEVGVGKSGAQIEEGGGEVEKEVGM